MGRYLPLICILLAASTAVMGLMWLRALRELPAIPGQIDDSLVGSWVNVAEPSQEVILTKDNRYYVFSSGHQIRFGQWYVEDGDLFKRSLKLQDPGETPGDFGRCEYSVAGDELRISSGWIRPTPSVFRRTVPRKA